MATVVRDSTEYGVRRHLPQSGVRARAAQAPAGQEESA